MGRRSGSNSKSRSILGVDHLGRPARPNQKGESRMKLDMSGQHSLDDDAERRATTRRRLGEAASTVAAVASAVAAAGSGVVLAAGVASSPAVHVASVVLSLSLLWLAIRLA